MMNKTLLPAQNTLRRKWYVVGSLIIGGPSCSQFRSDLRGKNDRTTLLYR